MEVGFWKDKRVLVTGAKGFLGSHLVKKLEDLGCILITPASHIFDLRLYTDTNALFRRYDKIDILFNLAANVGGIGYNQNHAYDLYHDNLMICTNLIHLATRFKVGKFVQLGTVCAYPKFTPVPFDERALWDGYPEETNAPYGLAKRMALLHLQLARQQYGLNGIFLLPTNLYGPGDHFEPERSHVIPALIKKFVENKEEVEIWGNGNATRDFLYVEDAVEGILLAAEHWDLPEPINLGSGQEIRISSLVHLISKLCAFSGKIVYNTTKPDGQPRRCLRVSNAKEFGWVAKTPLKEGLKKTIDWYLENK